MQLTPSVQLADAFDPWGHRLELFILSGHWTG